MCQKFTKLKPSNFSDSLRKSIPRRLDVSAFSTTSGLFPSAGPYVKRSQLQWVGDVVWPSACHLLTPKWHSMNETLPESAYLKRQRESIAARLLLAASFMWTRTNRNLVLGCETCILAFPATSTQALSQRDFSCSFLYSVVKQTGQNDVLEILHPCSQEIWPSS